MLQHPAAVRAAFHDASDSLLAVLRAVRPEQWDRPGALGDWTTRELAAHALRAYVTVDGYLAAAPSTDRILADAGVPVSVRRSRGQDVAGACGQLVRESLGRMRP